MKLEHLLFIFVIFFSSCKGLNSIERNNIIYTLMPKAKKKVLSKVELLKHEYQELYIGLFFTKEGYSLMLCPKNSLEKKKIQNLKLKKTGRVLEINNEYYYLFFSTDESLGGYLKSFKQKSENMMSRSTTINENAILLRFDWEWNLIED